MGIGVPATPSHDIHVLIGNSSGVDRHPVLGRDVLSAVKAQAKSWVGMVAEYAPTVACTLILACAKTTPAALTPEGARVRVSDASGVEGCEYIGDFVASQPSGKALPGWLATGQVRNRAAERGATNVVWDDQVRGNLVGKGYRCP
jgi:hypothetical protein